MSEDRPGTVPAEQEKLFTQEPNTVSRTCEREEELRELCTKVVASSQPETGGAAPPEADETTKLEGGGFFNGKLADLSP